MAVEVDRQGALPVLFLRSEHDLIDQTADGLDRLPASGISAQCLDQLGHMPVIDLTCPRNWSFGVRVLVADRARGGVGLGEVVRGVRFVDGEPHLQDAA